MAGNDIPDGTPVPLVTPQTKASPRPTKAALKREMEQAEMELAIVESRYTAGLMKQLMESEQKLQEAQFIFAEPDEGNWESITSGTALTMQKTLGEQRDPMTVRRQMYRFWRFHPHARGILRNFVRFILGPGFGLDYDDTQRGHWSDQKKSKVVMTADTNMDDSPAVNIVWDDFEVRNKFKQRRKEIVLRTFRDGECFIRRFIRNGKVSIRFVEPERVVNAGAGIGSSAVFSGQVMPGDTEDDEHVGEPTRIKGGIEFLRDDIETVVAYHIQTSVVGDMSANTFQRVPAKEMIHIKALADMNDLRGIPVLEVVAKRLTNYDQWEEYRLILNKMRTAIALVRKVTGTSTQAEAIIRGRLSPRQEPHRLEPQTQSARRETMFRPGTTLTPSPGVEYDFISPNLQARDASEDGRRFLMSIAAGVGLPEMLVTGDWSNSNFASSVEARTPAVREWGDWQEFFEGPFQQIYKWVIDAAVEDLGLPEDTSRDVTIQWPPLIAKDAFKETERNMNLWASGLMSKQTWSAREDLIYDDEQANLADEHAEEAAQQQQLGVGPDGAPLNGTQQVDIAKMPTKPQTKTAGPQPLSKLVPDAKKSNNPDTPDAAGAPKNPKTAAEAITEYRTSLRSLREDIEQIEDPLVKAAMERYVMAANRALILTTQPNGSHRAAASARRASRPRR